MQANFIPTMASYSLQEEDNHDVIIPVEQVARDIKKEIERCTEGLRSNIAARSTCCIYKVPLSRFKNNDDRSYRSRFVSIGPYYYDDEKLNGDYKYQCLGYFLSRTGAKGIGLELEDFMGKLHTLEGQARACYSGEIDLNSSGEFLKMMVVDASFILGLFYKFQDRGPLETVEPLKWGLQYLYEDLLLFQNQIPFFVLQELFNISKMPDDPSLYLLALRFFNNIMRRPKAFIKWYARDLEMSYADPENRPLHLLDLVRSSLIPSNPMPPLNVGRIHGVTSYICMKLHDFLGCMMMQLPCILCFLAFLVMQLLDHFCGEDYDNDEDTQVQFIPCISKLRRSGIRVRPGKAERLLDVKFEYGVIKMPSITMNDFMRSLLLNCLAFEQFHESSSKYVTVYATFLDCLVNTAEDVQYLRDCNIIDNSLADDDNVAQFINSLGKDLKFDKRDFYLDKAFNDVDKYSRNRFNVQRASFKRKYLNSPWSCISVLAGVVLLLLTITQTVFTILVYAHPKK